MALDTDRKVPPWALAVPSGVATYHRGESDEWGRWLVAGHYEGDH